MSRGDVEWLWERDVRRQALGAEAAATKQREVERPWRRAEGTPAPWTSCAPSLSGPLRVVLLSGTWEWAGGAEHAPSNGSLILVKIDFVRGH